MVLVSCDTQKQWREEGRNIFMKTRELAYEEVKENKVANVSRFRDGRIVIGYDVNVRAFYGEMSTRLDKTELYLKYVREKSELVLNRKL